MALSYYPRSHNVTAILCNVVAKFGLLSSIRDSFIVNAFLKQATALIPLPSKLYNSPRSSHVDANALLIDP